MARNTILLDGGARRENGITTAATAPGSLLSPSGTGEQWARHGAGGVISPIAFADVQWENDGADIADNIANADSCTVLFPEQGAVINCVSTDTLVRGDEVTAGANGTVVIRTAGDPLLGVCKAPQADGRVPVYIGGAVPLESA